MLEEVKFVLTHSKVCLQRYALYRRTLSGGVSDQAEALDRVFELNRVYYISGGTLKLSSGPNRIAGMPSLSCVLYPHRTLCAQIMSFSSGRIREFN